MDETIAAAPGLEVPPPVIPARVTATMLGDLVRCEMRVQLDMHGDPGDRAPVNGFVEMLWRQGNRHEAAIIAELPGVVADIRDVPMPERPAATVAAMAGDADWVVGARLLVDDLEGRPDLLHREGGTWRAGDVKSGGAFQPNGRDPRREYTAQAGLYGQMLDALGLGAGDRVFIIGSDGAQAWFDMDAPISRGGPSVADFTSGLVTRARSIRDGSVTARPALSSICGLCVWRTTCRSVLEGAGDLTLVPGLGRSVRTALEPVAATVADLAALDVGAQAAAGGRTLIQGVGVGRLALFRERARVLTTRAAPFAVEPLGLARREVEHHLDLETDPTCDDFCYLHGVLRRRRVNGVDVEDYVHFLAEDPSMERQAFAATVDFLSADPAALITTFSAFERTTYRRLAQRYPEVGPERVEALFQPGRCVDLYFDVILKSTHWPLNSLGLKAVAKHLGFDWDDPDASGAASIRWFVEWSETRDPALLARILRYNMNDTIASRVVFDGAMALPVMSALPWPFSGGGR
jgi:predicted RecB family nuclease